MFTHPFSLVPSLLILPKGARAMPVTRPLATLLPLRKRRLAALTTLGLAGLIAGLLSGCSSGNSSGINAETVASSNAFVAASGNWKFTTGATANLSALAGALIVSGSTVTGTLHPLTATCTPSTDLLPVTGTINTSGFLTITSAELAGGHLSISGTLAADRRSLTNPSIIVTGGSCATPATQPENPFAHLTTAASAQQFQPLTGNYNGTFTDSEGAALTVSATLSQPTTPDANGVYHLTGTASFPNDPCLNAPVITDSTVTGDSIQATYTDSQTGATVVGTGTFSADAETLTISSWTLSGCSEDTGTGLLFRQPA